MTPRLCVQDAVESKKRETMMVGLKQTQGQVGMLEESLTRVQLELERISFALQAKTGAVALVQATEVLRPYWPDAFDVYIECMAWT
jgi:ABC-type phosphate transport system auxiliary subunit